jgi:hypothetical protein
LNLSAGDDGTRFDDDQIPTPSLPDGWEDDFLSDAEEQYWPTYDDLSAAKTANKLAIHKAFKWIIPIGIGLAFLGFSAVLGVYVAHLILPEHLRWLSSDELQHIHSMIFSSVVGGAVAIFAKTYFLEGKSDS